MEPVTPQEAPPVLNPGDVADEWIERAQTDFALIARTKEKFYRDVFEDGRWRDCYSFADLSRRYSSLIRLIFSGVRTVEPSLQPPSQTEMHAWFTLFTQREQLVAANVPERLLPPNRGVAAALASATAKIADPVQKREAQKAILEKMEFESDLAAAKGCNRLPYTASTVREVAGLLGHRKKSSVRPLVFRELDELDAEAWGSIVQTITDLRVMYLSQLPAEKEHTQGLSLTRRLEGIALRPSRFVFGLFDAKECFTALLVENFVGKFLKMDASVKFAKRHTGLVTRNGASAVWSSTGFDSVAVVPPGEPGSDLPMIEPCGEGTYPCNHSRWVMVTDEKAADKVVDEAVAALQQTVVPIPLATWREWETRGGIPIGTYVDEVLEPSVDDEPVDEQDDAD